MGFECTKPLVLLINTLVQCFIFDVIVDLDPGIVNFHKDKNYNVQTCLYKDDRNVILYDKNYGVLSFD